MSAANPVTWSDHDAVLFDLDGVLTPTAEVHMRAWAEMFDAFLSTWDSPGADTSPYTDADYFAHVDGKPRYDGVRDLLTARGIRLPDGDPSDPPDGEHRVRPGQPQERRLQRGARPRRRHALPRLGARCSTRCASCGCRSRSSRRRPTPPPCSTPPAWPTGSSPSSTAGSPPRSGWPASRRPTPSCTPPPSAAPRPARSVVVEDAVSGVRAGAAGGVRAGHRRRPRCRRRRR